MVRGEFKCLGSTQHLKSKFSKGFVLTVKTGKPDAKSTEEIREHIQDVFPMAEMKEKYMDIMTFYIAVDDLKWSRIFQKCLQMKNEFGVEDYALSQTSLEQVFMLFTKAGYRQAGRL